MSSDPREPSADSTSPEVQDSESKPVSEPPLRRLVKTGPLSEIVASDAASVEPPTAAPDSEPAQQDPTAKQPGPEKTLVSAESPLGRAYPTKDPVDPAPVDLDSVDMEPSTPHEKVLPPSIRRPLSADLQQQLDSAFAGTSMDDLVAAAPSREISAPLESESRHQGTLMKIHGDNVFFALGGRNEGVASLRQFKEPPQVGTVLEVVVRSFLREDGLYELSIPGASVRVQDWSDVMEGAIVEAKVTGSNTGGLECAVGTIRGFIPASQVEAFRVEDFSEYIDQKLMCLVTEANERRGNLVLSHRALVEREKEEERKKLLEELQVGDVREGTVTSVRDFGAFVDIGGVDGLVHISRLSWDRVGHPSEVLEVGQKVRVKVEKVDQQTGKIGLSYRELLERPWTSAEERFAVDSIVQGTVTRTAAFGAFVKLAPGIEGLVHISELAHHRVVQVTNVVKEGEEIEVKILSIDSDAQRIALSLKDAHPMPETQKTLPADGSEKAEDEPPGKPVVRPRSGPLKGGTDKSSGGDKFGLKW